MGASLASESRLSRFGGPARRVVSLPDEEDPEEDREAQNAPMSPISGKRGIPVWLTSDAQEEPRIHLPSEDRPRASPPRHDIDFAAKPDRAPRSPPSTRMSPPPLTDTGRDNWLSHPKADTAKRKVDDPEPWAHPTPPSLASGHEVRPLRASRPAPTVSTVRAPELHSQPPQQSPQLPQQQWGPSEPVKAPPPAPPQAVPKRSFLVRWRQQPS